MNKRVKNAPNLIKFYNIDFLKQNFDILKYSVFIKIKPFMQKQVQSLNYLQWMKYLFN